MKLDNGANVVNATNAHNYSTSLSHIIKDIHNFSKKLDVGYSLFLEEHKHALKLLISKQV